MLDSQKEPEYSEEQKETILDNIAAVAETANDALVEIDQTLQMLKDQLKNPEQREEVILSVIKNATDALIAVDGQFTNIALTVDSILTGHNKLVQRFNETINNRAWLASVVDQRMEDRMRMLEEEEKILLLKNKMTCVHFGEFKDLTVGQIGTFIKYPSNPEQHSEEDIERLSNNIVTTCNADGVIESVLKTTDRIFFSAVSLFLSEEYTRRVQAGEIMPRVIKTLDGVDYVLLEVFMIIEIQSTSVETVISHEDI